VRTACRSRDRPCPVDDAERIVPAGAKDVNLRTNTGSAANVFVDALQRAYCALVTVLTANSSRWPSSRLVRHLARCYCCQQCTVVARCRATCYDSPTAFHSVTHHAKTNITVFAGKTQLWGAHHRDGTLSGCSPSFADAHLTRCSPQNGVVTGDSGGEQLSISSGFSQHRNASPPTRRTDVVTDQMTPPAAPPCFARLHCCIANCATSSLILGPVRASRSRSHAKARRR
jgi:hypothetical protein